MTTYLGRVDTIFIDQSGALSIIEGEPSENPQPPRRYLHRYPPVRYQPPRYTFNMQTVDLEKFDYKRYQMKDIASLERRIQRMEEAVTLNMLEQSALNVEVKDAVTGLDRFKNGIITDTFVDHSRGDTTHESIRQLSTLNSVCFVPPASPTRLSCRTIAHGPRAA